MDDLDDLFAMWKHERPFYKKFSNDGIINEDAWRSASRKIAFILKESNDDFVEIRGKSVEYRPSEGNSGCFWRNLNIWKYVVTSTLNGKEPSFEDAEKLRDCPVKGIAYVNLKKNAECRNRSDDRDISRYVEHDWKFLCRQIEIINPEVLFFCGTFRAVARKMDLITMSERVFRAGNQGVMDFFHPICRRRYIAVDFFHPSCRKGYKETFTLLSDLLARFYNGPPSS